MQSIAEKAEAAARRGAALLDRKVPGWRNHIDLKMLNINSCACCIIGQIYGGNRFTAGLRKLGLFPSANGEEVEYGFDLYRPIPPGDLEALNDAWRKIVLEGEPT